MKKTIFITPRFYLNEAQIQKYTNFMGMSGDELDAEFKQDMENMDKIDDATEVLINPMLISIKKYLSEHIKGISFLVKYVGQKISSYQNFSLDANNVELTIENKTNDPSEIYFVFTQNDPWTKIEENKVIIDRQGLPQYDNINGSKEEKEKKGIFGICIGIIESLGGPSFMKGVREV